MIPAALLLKLAPITAFLKKHWQVFAIGAALLALTVTVLVYGAAREQTGVTKTELRVERDHTETIREVRADEKLAQQITDAVDARLAAAQAAQRAETAKTTKEITDAFQALPPAPAGTVDRVAPAGVRDASNNLVDRANRAAEYTGPAD